MECLLSRSLQLTWFRGIQVYYLGNKFSYVNKPLCAHKANQQRNTISGGGFVLKTLMMLLRPSKLNLSCEGKEESTSTWGSAWGARVKLAVKDTAINQVCFNPTSCVQGQPKKTISWAVRNYHKKPQKLKSLKLWIRFFPHIIKSKVLMISLVPTTEWHIGWFYLYHNNWIFQRLCDIIAFMSWLA